MSSHFYHQKGGSRPLVGRILLSHGMARLPPHLCSYLLMILFDTTPRTVRRLNEPALGSAQQDSHLPRISPSCPHCLSLWLDSEYRSTVSLRDSLPKLLWAGWVSLGHLSRPSFMRSSPHRWVLAHPPHRCSPSSGAR